MLFFSPLNGKFIQEKQFIKANQLLRLRCSEECICSFQWGNYICKWGKEWANALHLLGQGTAESPGIRRPGQEGSSPALGCLDSDAGDPIPTVAEFQQLENNLPKWATTSRWDWESANRVREPVRMKGSKGRLKWASEVANRVKARDTGLCVVPPWARPQRWVLV